MIATEFWQPCFSKFAFFLKIGCNSIVISGVTILHLKRFISERNKWFYAESDWSIQLYFSSCQQRRVFLSSGWFVTKVSFMSRVMCNSRKRDTRPPSSRYKTVRNILWLFCVSANRAHPKGDSANINNWLNLWRNVKHKLALFYKSNCHCWWNPSFYCLVWEKTWVSMTKWHILSLIFNSVHFPQICIFCVLFGS